MPITSEVVNVSPSLAKEWLKHNAANRNISQRLVDKYSADMVAGDWELNGESIVFYESGRLKDGQHRLSAVVKSGATVPMVVIWGIGDVSKFHDGGRNRKITDIMALDGFEAALRESRTIGAVNFLLKNYGNAQYRNASRHQVINFISANKELLVESSSVVMKGGSNPIPCRKSSIIAAAFCALANGIRLETLERFFTVANSGFYDSEKDTAAIVFRNFILSPSKYEPKISIGKGGAFEQVRFFEVAIRAINDFSNETPRQRFYSDRKETSFEKKMKEEFFNAAS